MGISLNNFFENRKTVEIRQSNIQKHGVKLMVLDPLEGLSPCFSHLDVVSLSFEQIL